MRIAFDADRCTGHGRCYMLVPEMFEPDERGHCVVLADELIAELEEQAKTAVTNCPERALRIED